MSYMNPRNDLQHSRQRLDSILSSPRLTFNPYTVSDNRLLQIVANADWGGEYDIVEAVVLTFTRLRPVNNPRKFDGIYVSLGNKPGESFISTSSLIYGATALDSLQPERNTIGNRRITNPDHVAALVGKRVFVSRIIRGRNPAGVIHPVYKMTRLKGDVTKDAATIRTAMCQAKIEMLQRILDHPDCDFHLNCSRNFFDYQPRIQRAIRIIESWSNLIPPAE